MDYYNMHIQTRGGQTRSARIKPTDPCDSVGSGRVRSVTTGPAGNVSVFGRFSRVGGGWFNSTRRSPNPNRSYYLLINIILFSEFHPYINTKCWETLILSSFFSLSRRWTHSSFFLPLVNFFILLHFLHLLFIFFVVTLIFVHLVQCFLYSNFMLLLFWKK
jgi:hypothetical protein